MLAWSSSTATASPPTTANRPASTTHITRRRSQRSSSAPLNRPNSSHGSHSAKLTSDTSSGSRVSVAASNGSAVPYTPSPRFETPDAAHSLLNPFPRNPLPDLGVQTSTTWGSRPQPESRAAATPTRRRRVPRWGSVADPRMRFPRLSTAPGTPGPRPPAPSAPGLPGAPRPGPRVPPTRHRATSVCSDLRGRARWAAMLGPMGGDVEGLRVGMLGCGAVGTGVARLLVEHGRPVRDRAGVPIALQRVAVRDVTRKRDPAVDPTMVSGDAAAVVADPEVDVVVEVMGGIEPARSLILEAIRLGKPVVTANKELLAAHGGELFDAADAAGVDLRFEAAVGGAIPIVAPLKESLAGDRLRRVLGIVNGTTNYVLWRMASTGAGYAEALAEATELGYAEPDPSADVEGFDAAAKCAILASLAFNTRVVSGDVYREGITGVT